MISKFVDPDLFLHLLSEILILCPPKRISKYSTEYYLCILLYILKTGVSYRACIGPIDDAPKGHYTTIYKKFKQWANAGVFELIYNRLFKAYIDLEYPNIDSLDLFVDSTHIRNKNGQDLISYGKKDKGKKGTTVSLVVDSKRFPIYTQIDPANFHDGRIIDSILDSLDKGENLPKKLKVVGDKGYVKKNRFRKGERTVKLVFPVRKNQKIKNTQKELNLIKKRPVIENVFASLKQYKKITNRYERMSLNYFKY